MLKIGVTLFFSFYENIGPTEPKTFFCHPKILGQLFFIGPGVRLPLLTPKNREISKYPNMVMLYIIFFRLVGTH